MKKLMKRVLAAKSLAAMVFAGFICAYVAAGYLYALLVRHGQFNFTIPFIFVLEGLALSIIIAVLWYFLFGDNTVVKMRYSSRLMIFALAIMVSLAICVLVFVPFHTDWAKLWWIVIGCVAAGVVALSVIGEIYSRVTGNRYTELLKIYQSEQQESSRKQK